jgi:hypothetical protein
MHYSNVLFVAASLASVAIAQEANGPNAFTDVGENWSCAAGQTCELAWTPDTGKTVTIKYMTGNSAALKDGGDLAVNIENSGKTTVTIPANVRGPVAIKICADNNCSDETKVNYSTQFTVDGTGAVTGVETVTGEATATETVVPSGTATVTAEPTETETVAATGAETVTGTDTETVPAATVTGTQTETATATETETETEEATSTSTNTVEAPDSAASVTRSSSLAMAVCVFAAVFYLN